MRPDLVIFDCDGVLVDSETITNQLLRDDLAARGLDLPLDQIMALFVGGTMKSVGVEAAKMGADIPVGWVDDFYERMYAALEEGTPLIAGVPQMLHALDEAGVPYAVGSNGSEVKMRTTLGQHPRVWARLKDRLYSAHTLGVAKPAPDLFLKAASDAGVAPKRCAVIDDSPSGCRAGVAAGMRCLGLAEHDDGARLKALGAEVVHSLAQAQARLLLEAD